MACVTPKSTQRTMTVPFEPVYAEANPETKIPHGGAGIHAYRFGDRDLQRIRGCDMHLHKFRTIRPDIQGGDEPGCTVLLLQDVDMGQRGVICFETLELLADGLKCGRVRPSFLASECLRVYFFANEAACSSCVFVCGTDLHRPCFQI